MTVASASPWVDFLESRCGTDYLETTLSHLPEALTGLDSLPADAAEQLVAERLGRVLFPVKSAVLALQKILGIAAADARTRFPDTRSFIQNISSQHPPEGADKLVCMTGPAGAGKSTICRALRLISSGARPIPIAGHGQHQHAPFGSFRFQDRWSAGEMARQLGAPVDNSINLPRRLYAQGCGLIVIDESQFMTRSDRVARTVGIIGSLSRLGPPVLSVCNFSLLRKFQRRPQEETDRMLANVIILEPDLPGSNSWKDLIAAYAHVLSEYVDESVVRHADDLWGYTAGSKRYCIKLLSIAYRIGRNEGRKFGFADVRRAYMSREFSDMRSTVEALCRIAAGTESRRPDLIAPMNVATGSEFAEALREQKKAQDADAIGRASLSRQQRAALADIEREGQPPLPSERPPRTKPVKVTAASLLQAGAAFAAKNGASSSH